MTFRVEPQAIRSLADHMHEAHHAADTATQYLHRYSDIGTQGTGVLGQALGSHADFVSQLDRMLARLGKLADASEKALRQAATRYEHTDRDSAAKIDASYPRIPRSTHAFD
jgi:uncharacterized protein YukE